MISVINVVLSEIIAKLSMFNISIQFY